jgi:type II secretory pathway pseudopilin PulG
MISRRDVVTAGVLGSLSTAAVASADTGSAEQSGEQAVQNQLMMINRNLQTLNTSVQNGLVGPGLGNGWISDIRDRLTVHLRSTGKFPDFMEIGTDPFYDVYDWHVRHAQQIQITRLADQRFAIQFMFTQLVVRWEQDRRFLGQPYDRGQ